MASENILIVGPAGAGKSTLGRRLASRLGVDFYDIDRLIESHLGVTIDVIFDKEGEDGFRKRETEMLKTVLGEVKHAVIATGGGCVLIDENRQLLRNERLVIYLDVKLKTQYARVIRDSRRPLLQQEDVYTTLKLQRIKRTPLYESVADLSFLSDTLNLTEVEQTVKQSLSIA